ncbi:hypothetical protein INT44_003542 [Umbelopsis vinacea]|uniref:Uncharacterized protein n=1 Tax=Umbelopsis vinacea TaxID=44442 RepID=A0A8H7PVC4_9FUNG|nr:hypothetical protein INT44_003542 [Umbelopsis vinacea]
MEHTSGVISQAIMLVLNKASETLHGLKRYYQATMWTDWPDHIRANTRDWLKDILARVFERTKGNAVPGDLLKIDSSQWGRKQAVPKLRDCAIGTLPEIHRCERIDIIRNHLDNGMEHVDRHFSDKTQAQRNRARREYAAWCDALCDGIAHASGLLKLNNYARAVPATEVDRCLKRLLKGTTVATKDTHLLIEKYQLEPMLRRGYRYN